MGPMLPGVTTGVPVFAGYSPQYPGAVQQLVVPMPGAGIGSKPALLSAPPMVANTLPHAPYLGGMAPAQQPFVMPPNMVGGLPMPVSPPPGVAGMSTPDPYGAGRMGPGVPMPMGSGYVPSGVQQQWHDPLPRTPNASGDSANQAPKKASNKKSESESGVSGEPEAKSEGDIPASD